MVCNNSPFKYRHWSLVSVYKPVCVSTLFPRNRPDSLTVTKKKVNYDQKRSQYALRSKEITIFTIQISK